uniref:Uncharacterized protein n=1 Tax=Vespula pensylvanica TaxID=30213 RepID=A0A834P889_VESPE|nr:hypothetical protein H0235_004843 [Vespula pensylvanica]
MDVDIKREAGGRDQARSPASWTMDVVSSLTSTLFVEVNVEEEEKEEKEERDGIDDRRAFREYRKCRKYDGELRDEVPQTLTVSPSYPERA